MRLAGVQGAGHRRRHVHEGHRVIQRAAKRLEAAGQERKDKRYRICPCPSKVRATIEAVKSQFPGRPFDSCTGITYLQQPQRAVPERYRGPWSRLIRRWCSIRSTPWSEAPPDAAPGKGKEGFAKEGLAVINEKEELHAWLTQTIFMKMLTCY